MNNPSANLTEPSVTPESLSEAIDRLVWNTVSLRLVVSGGVHASLSTRRDIERLVGESRKQLTDELAKALSTATSSTQSDPK